VSTRVEENYSTPCVARVTRHSPTHVHPLDWSLPIMAQMMLTCWNYIP